MSTLTITIDGKTTSVPAGSTILDAATKLDIEIPTLCYFNLEELKYNNKAASCRICVVEVEGRATWPRPAPPPSPTAWWSRPTPCAC